MIATIATFFGAIIRFIYHILGNNYALSIIIFTIFTKLILLPLYIKQMKSQEELNKIAPLDKKIREKYKDNKEKMSEEVTKLYAEHKINPLGGCLPLLIQIPIIIAMFYIVKQPLTYIIQMPQEEIKTYTMTLLNKEDVTTGEMQSNEITVAKDNNIIDMSFIGINLGDTPSNVFSKDETEKASPFSLLIPILSLVVSIIQVKQMKKNSNMTEEQMEMQKTNNLMMPLFSAFISYTMPLALGIYWLLGSVFQLVQQYVINKIIKKDTEKEKLLKEGK